MDENTVSTLRDLLKVSEDGERGFAEAANIATDGKLKMLFTNRSKECADAVRELEQLIVSLGGPAKADGSVAGDLHRGWLKMKSSVKDKNIAVMEEVERGEDHAKAAYTKALRADLPANIRSVIEKQAQGTIRNHNQVRDLRNAYKAETA